MLRAPFVLPVCLALRYPTLARRGSKIEWSDWNIFSRHSFYLLLGGYFGVADQQVNTILINKMGSVDLAGNSLIGTMMSYPYIFAGAFGTVISTLGSKYIGQRDDRAYLKLGLMMIVLSGAIGASLGVAVVFFADDILDSTYEYSTYVGLYSYTNEQDVIDICLRLPDASIGWLAFCS